MNRVRLLLTLALLPAFIQAQCILPIPYTENFNSAAWVIPPTTAQTGSIAPCWTRTPSTNTFMWVPGPSAVINNFTGPLSDVTGNGKFIYTETVSFSTPPNPAFILTPFLNLATATAPQVSFYYYMFGSQIGSLTVQASNGGAWTTLGTIPGQQHTNNSSTWLKVTYPLTAFAGDTIRIRFQGLKANTSNLSRIAVDEIVVEEAPTCAPVSNIYVTGTTGNSTNLGWFVGSVTSTSWEVQYGKEGFTLGTGTIITTSSNPVLISGLSGSTTYDFYVREVCSLTDKSPWEGPQQTTTLCSSPVIPPYVENFDGNKWEPYVNTANIGSMAPCWAPNPSAMFSYMWLVNPNTLASSNTGPSSDHTTGTGKYVAAQSLAGTNLDPILRSPQFDLTAIANPEMTFWYHMYGNGIAKLEVEIRPLTSSTWTNILTVTGQQQTSSTAPWQKATISLAAYATSTVYIRFRAVRNSTSNLSAKISIDDFSILPGSGCPSPTSLVVNNISATKARVNFAGTAGGSYQVKYGPPGFTPNTQGISVLTTTSPVNIQPLTQNTSYEVYVRKFCTNNDTSSWTGPVLFKTPCVVNAPYAEPYTSASWVVGGTFPNVLGAIDPCYNRTEDNTYWWSPGPEAFPSFQSGPSADHTTGNGKYLFTNTQSFGGTAPLIADFVTPQINLVPLNVPELSFWYHMYGSQIGDLIVQINNGSGWTTLTTISGQQQTSKTAPWLEAIFNLSAYADDTIQLRFRGTKGINLFNTEIAIDDLNIHELPSCPKPSAFATNNVTFNSARFTWTTGGATNWLIKYGPPGFTTGTFVATSTNPRVITGLSPNTNYEAWIRDSCGANNVSQWVGPIYFRTNCLPVTAPFIENFSGSTFVPWSFTDQDGNINSCYTRSDTTSFFWVPGPGQGTSFQTGPSGDKTTGTGKYMFTRTYSFNGGVSTSLHTPFINLGTIAQPQLRFWYHMYGLNIDKLEVRVRTYSGQVTLVKTITGQQQFSSTAAWLQEVVDLTAFAGDTIRIQFSGYNSGIGNRSEIALDDIEVGVPLLCTAPTNLSLSNITASTITVNWTKSASATSSIIEYGPTGFTPGTGTLIHNVTSPHVITGLTGSTAYQFYVRDSCSWGGLSTQIGPQAATTLACPPVTASFTSTTTGLSVAFNAAASGPNITSYTWDFGNGFTGNGVNPTHVYTTGGSYTVTLVVANACGSTQTITQTVVVCTTISGQFTTGISALTVTFSSSSVLGTGLQYAWLYGDGNSGTGPSPSHTYIADGAYNVQLIVTDLCGKVDTITQTVTVCSPLTPAIVFVQNGLDVNFSVTGANYATNYNWNFGDANTGSGATPLHTYAATGTYNVTVTVTNLCGQQATASAIVTLCELPIAKWTFTILSSNSSGMTVQFNGTASIGASSFLWEFGDGATNNVSAIPVHKYVPAGLFWVVKLTVYNDCGDEGVSQSSLASIGIEDFEAAGVKTFPNPADDEVVLFVPAYLGLQSAELLSTNGSILARSAQQGQEEVRFATSELPEGVYYIRLQSDAGEATFKVVVKH